MSPDLGGRGALWPALLPPSKHGEDELRLRSAHGVQLTTADGRTLLCGTSGLWNVNLGYGNEAITSAVTEAMEKASYLSVFRSENTGAREAADALVEAAGSHHYQRVHFTTSGGSANDLVMKLARHYHALRGEPRRRLVVGLRQGYHGLTFGSFALTSDSLGQQMYGVDRSLICYVDPDDVDGLERLLEREGHRVAAVVVEPQLGTGAIPLSPEYVSALSRLRAAHGFLLVADEVATGFGRLGSMFASHTWVAAPDVLVTSKGLTNGTMPAAAVLVTGEVAAPFVDADAVFAHAETQAGTAVSAAAIMATLDEMRRLDAVAHGRQVATWLDSGIDRLLDSSPYVAGSRGQGCFRALRVTTPSGATVRADGVSSVVASIREAGAVVHPGPDGVQLVPALVYSEDQVRQLIDAVAVGLRHHFEHAEVAR